MRKNLMFLALAALGFAGCNGGFKQDDSGILYNLHSEKSKVKIKEGDFISVNLVAKNDADSVIFNSYDSGQPQYLIVQAHQFKGDLMDGLKLVGEGDSVTFKMAADSVFKGGQQRPPSFKSSKYVVYDIKVQKVIPKGKLTDEVFQRTISTYVREQSENVKKQEPAKIKKYIDDNKLKATQAPAGFYYVVTKQGSGPVLAPSDTAVVYYSGKLINGKVFDTNIKEEAIKAKLPQIEMRPFQPIRFPVGMPAGQEQVIPGWNQGLLLFNKGTKATLIIPSELGYGEQAQRDMIPANSPLVFDIEIVDIVHPSQAVKK